MRKVININKDWYFSKTTSFPQKVNPSSMEKINLPHTWNAIDGNDGGGDYYRGECLYYKNLGKFDLKDEELYLEFNGSNMVTRVFLNNHYLGIHKGGYSTFRFNITKYISDDEDNILVCYVDNSFSYEVYPQRADFTFYGGIYRDVNLIKVPSTHFDLDYYGSKGLKITPQVNGKVEVELFLKNAEGKNVEVSIFDQEKNKVAKGNATIKDNKATLFFNIDNPHLWNGLNDAYLYYLEAKIDEDEISDHFGFRSYKIDPEKGFILNGKEYPLIGVSAHQDRQKVGTALSKQMHKEDLDLIKEIGATTIRLAHYQHDQYVYDLSDEYGFCLWAEIPYISEHMVDGKENAELQLRELIIQNYNHPSIFVWGLSNEITVTTGYTQDIYDFHVYLNNIAHELDKTRLTTMANLFMLETSSPLVKVPDVRSFNLYYGWYTGEKEDNDKWFDKFHQEYPNIAIGLSEFGADCNVKYQSKNPEKGDYSETYQALYHEHMLKMRMERKYIWAMHVWNMFDFGADSRDEGGKKGINQKGLVTFDRKTKKDAFYVYKAYLSKEPFIHLGGKRYIKRSGEETTIKVYSSLDEVSLYINGELFETQKSHAVFTFIVPLNGDIHVKAIAKNLVEEMDIIKVEQEDKEYIIENKQQVVNWFDASEGLDENYFSIKDKVKDIKSHPVAGPAYQKMMEMAMKGMGDVAKNVTIPKEMQERMDNMTLEDNLKMAGHLVKQDMIKELNKVLQGIKK
jgi:beta-galactosidase